MLWLNDAFSLYLHGLKAAAVVLAVIFLISGLDDLFIDLAYWSRRVWRFATVYGRHQRLNPCVLRTLGEKPLAIMVPAWQEHGMAGRMAELAATLLDYENYHIFVGTYPNDAQTQREVEQVKARCPNVHQVVCPRPGPASKADCLNNILAAVLQFEQRASLKFEGFVLHDAQDVLSHSELRVFNFLVDGGKDLIQLPVYALPRQWHAWSAGHDLDEGAEKYGKDVVVREALSGQVDSAGVGTCLSRRAILLLLEEGGGMAFDPHSPSGHHGLGCRLKAHGLSEVFARVPADTPADEAAVQRGWCSLRQARTVAVHKYFPATFSAAVQHTSRAMAAALCPDCAGCKGKASAAMRYFAWRDRKFVLTHLASLLALLLALQLTLLWAYGQRVPEGARFAPLFQGDGRLAALLLLNAGLIANRLAQRLVFVTACYGIVQGLLSLPRMLWGHVINVAANWQALKRLASGEVRPMAWDRSSHEFPGLGQPGPQRKALGQILVLHKAISQAQLSVALQTSVRGLRLGSQLVHQGLISTEQLAMALAAQGQVRWETVDALSLPSTLLARMPASMALHYAVLPLREEGPVLVLACESNLDPVSLAAIARKLARPVRYVIVPKGQVVVGLRHAYARQRTTSARFLLDKVIAAGDLTPAEAEPIWQEYVSLQLLMGEVLQSLGRLDAATLSAVLLRQERSGASLGKFLIREGVVSEAALDEALQLQQQHQVSMLTLLERAGKPPTLARAQVKKVHVA